jgi:hypothetical protein
LCVNKSQFVPVIFEPPCTCPYHCSSLFLFALLKVFVSVFLLLCSKCSKCGTPPSKPYRNVKQFLYVTV